MTTEEALEKLAQSKFRSGFKLDKSDIEYIEKRAWQQSVFTPKISSEKGLHLQSYPMTAGRLPPKDIPFSRLSTDVPAAAEDASKNGTKYRRIKN